MHKLLERQVRRIATLPGAPEVPEEFLRMVDGAYRQGDDDRALLQRALEMASDELVTRNRELRKELEDRQRLELELRQAQKLEAVGQLAAGVAHEINTPIQFVGDSAHFLRDAFADLRGLIEAYRALAEAAATGAAGPDMAGELAAQEEELDLEFLTEQIPKAIERTLEGSNRVAEIVRAMKEFAHPRQDEQAAADLNRAILSTLTVASNELKYVADVETDLAPLPPIVCHIGDLNQVVLNLVVNAAHAIADADARQRGTIRVSTALEEPGSVVIRVSDTGGGIPEEIRGRVFDPFFTTKEVGRGTGQGLAITYALVCEKHGGSVRFDTETGRGTTFEVRLPVAGVSLPDPPTTERPAR